MPPLIEINGLGKQFKDHWVIRGVDFSIERGEVVVLQGPSGIGKTTLLRCMTGLQPFEEGTIRVGDVAVSKGMTEHTHPDIIRSLHKQVGIVFQFFHLFPHLTVLQNLTLGPVQVLKEPEDQANENGLNLLKRVGLVEKAESYPLTLSGGQQQRVAVARALAMRPQVVFFDEPTSSLDPSKKEEVLQLIQSFSEQGLTMVIVTHEPEIVKRIATRSVQLGPECRVL